MENRTLRGQATLMLAAAVHLAMVAVPSTALAQGHDSAPVPAPSRPGGDDVIYLKNGGMLRGTIVDVIPDSQARIQLATGELATVPWPQVDHVEHGGAPPPPAPVPAAAVAPPPSEVWVHLDAPEGVELQQDRTSDDDYQTVCSAPCDKLLPTAFYYRVIGGGIKASGDFTLHGSPGTRERVVVDGASKTSFVLGVIGMAGGVVVAYVGLIVIDVGLLASSFGGGSGTSNTGLTMMGAGAFLAIGGLILTLSNGKTKVSQNLDLGRAGLLGPGPGTKTPLSGAMATEQRILPPAIGLPILSGRF